MSRRVRLRLQSHLHRIRRLRQRIGELRPLRLSSHRDVHRLRAPGPDEFGAFAADAFVLPPAGVVGSDRVHLGRGVRIHEGVSILAHGDDAMVEVGAGTVLARFAHIDCVDRITIGARVMSSDHIAVIDNWGPGDAPYPPSAVRIEDGAYLGYGCIVGPGVTVGAGAFVGEGAVVLDDVAPHHVVYGNPARTVRTWTGDRWSGPRFP